MSRAVQSRLMVVLLAVALGILYAAPASACSVCFGDPDSPMVKGAAAGILVLGGVVYTLLAGILGITIFWIVRARRLSALEIPAVASVEEESSQKTADDPATHSRV